MVTPKKKKKTKQKKKLKNKNKTKNKKKKKKKPAIGVGISSANPTWARTTRATRARTGAKFIFLLFAQTKQKQKRL